MRSLFIFSILLIASFFTAAAQWTQCNGPSWGSVQTIEATQGNTMFLGLSVGGIFRSKESSRDWSRSGLIEQNIKIIVAKGITIFAGTDKEGIFRSTNNGDSWKSVNTGLGYQTVLSLAYSKSYVFAGTDGRGMFRSDNNGDSWSAINTGLTNLKILSIVIYNSSIIVGTDGDGAFRSYNGETWVAMNRYAEKLTIVSLEVKDDNLFAGTLENGMYICTLFAGSWGTFSQLENIPSHIFVKDSILMVGTDKGTIFKSTDYGNTWKSSFLDQITRITDMEEFEGFIIVGTNDGTYISRDNGDTWESLKLGTASYGNIYDIYVHDSMLYLAKKDQVLQCHKSLKYHDNLGTYEKDFPNSNYAILKFLSYLQYLMVERTDGLYMVPSIKNGIPEWFPYKPYDSALYVNNPIKRIHTINNGLLILTENGKVFLHPPGSGYEIKVPNHQRVNRVFTSRGQIFASVQEGYFYVTKNFGISWKNITIQEKSIVETVASPNGIIYALTEDKKLFKYIKDSIVSVEEKKSNANNFTTSIKPNPNDGSFHISTNMFDGASPVKVEIFTNHGEKLFEKESYHSSLDIDASSITSGAYYIVIRSGNQIDRQLFYINK